MLCVILQRAKDEANPKLKREANARNQSKTTTNTQMKRNETKKKPITTEAIEEE